MAKKSSGLTNAGTILGLVGSIIAMIEIITQLLGQVAVGIDNLPSSGIGGSGDARLVINIVIAIILILLALERFDIGEPLVLGILFIILGWIVYGIGGILVVLGGFFIIIDTFL